MNLSPFTFCVIQYVHDPIADERINIGLALHCPDFRFFAVRLDNRYEHLSCVFSDFAGEAHRQTLGRLKLALEREHTRLMIEARQPKLFALDADRRGISEYEEDVKLVMSRVWSDNFLNYRYTTIAAGLTDNPRQEIEFLFDRYISNQRPQLREIKSRTDEDVWSKFRSALDPYLIVPHLSAKSFETPQVEVSFKYAYKNERWHILQPLTLDYADPHTMQDKAAKWFGIGWGLREADDLGTLYLLLGEPKQKSHRKEYERAKKLLREIPVAKQIVEEDEASDFARDLASKMEEEGVLTPKAHVADSSPIL